MIVLGTNLNFIYIIPIEKSTGEPISWDTLGAIGSIPGAMTSAAGQLLTPVRRQYTASVVMTDTVRPKKKKQHTKHRHTKEKQMDDESSKKTTEILIFGGIVHNPKSSLTDEIHSLTLNVTDGYAKWKQLPQRGKSIPSARIGHSFTFMKYQSSHTNSNNHHLFLFGGTDSQAFRQDFYLLDLATPISKTDVTVHVGEVHSYEHSPHTKDLCAPRGATITRVWNTQTLRHNSKKSNDVPTNAATTGTTTTTASADNTSVVETAQFIVIGGSRSGASNEMNTSWTVPANTLIGYHGDIHSTQCITRQVCVVKLTKFGTQQQKDCANETVRMYCLTLDFLIS